MLQIDSKFARRICFASRLFHPYSSAQIIDGNKNEGIHHNLLESYGFVKRVGLASFAYLPPFMRTLNKLNNIVEHELESIGAQKIELPLLLPQKWWLESGRLERNDKSLENLYTTIDRSKEIKILAPTHEEAVSKLVSSFKSLNNFPLLLYQSTSKFRDEPRPRHGLLRANQFLMNDAYSFDVDQSSAEKTYNRVVASYNRILQKLNLNSVVAESDPGSIGGLYSHEFQIEVSCGEDKLYNCLRCDKYFNKEMNLTECPYCHVKLKFNEKSFIELAHTFLLGTTYSEPLKVTHYSSSSCKRNPLFMGCYGLGISRIVAAGLEALSTSNGLRWPKGIEPFKVAIIKSKYINADRVSKLTTKLLTDTNVDVLVSDKSASVGKRVYQAQRLGIPYIIVFGNKNLDSKSLDHIEFIQQSGNDYETINSLSISDVIARLILTDE